MASESSVRTWSITPAVVCNDDDITKLRVYLQWQPTTNMGKVHDVDNLHTYSGPLKISPHI